MFGAGLLANQPSNCYSELMYYKQPGSDRCRARSVKLSVGPRGDVYTFESQLWDLRVRLLKSNLPRRIKNRIPGPFHNNIANWTEFPKRRLTPKLRSSHKSVVTTVALWDSRLTRRPFSRWTAAAFHCGYEEENRDERNISRDFNSLCPTVSPSPRTSLSSN